MQSGEDLTGPSGPGPPSLISSSPEISVSHVSIFSAEILRWKEQLKSQWKFGDLQLRQPQTLSGFQGEEAPEVDADIADFQRTTAVISNNFQRSANQGSTSFGTKVDGGGVTVNLSRMQNMKELRQSTSLHRAIDNIWKDLEPKPRIIKHKRRNRISDGARSCEAREWRETRAADASIVRLCQCLRLALFEKVSPESALNGAMVDLLFLRQKSTSTFKDNCKSIFCVESVFKMSFIFFLHSMVGQIGMEMTYISFLGNIKDECCRIAIHLPEASTISPFFRGKIISESELAVSRLQPTEHRMYAFHIGPELPSIVVRAQIFHGNAIMSISFGGIPSAVCGDYIRELSKESGCKKQIIIAPHDPRLCPGFMYVGIWAGDQCAVPGGSRIHLSIRTAKSDSLRLGSMAKENEKNCLLKKAQRVYFCLELAGSTGLHAEQMISVKVSAHSSLHRASLRASRPVSCTSISSPHDNVAKKQIKAGNVAWKAYGSHNKPVHGPDLCFSCRVREILNREWYVSIQGESNTREDMKMRISSSYDTVVRSIEDRRVQERDEEMRSHQLVRGYSLGRCKWWELSKGCSQHRFQFDLPASHIYSEIMIFILPECGKFKVTISRPEEMRLESPPSWSGSFKVSSCRRYSPTSAWCKTTCEVGGNVRHISVA